MFRKRLILILATSFLMIFCFSFLSFAEIITLNSGKTVEGKIVEETEKYVKIIFMGTTLTYWREDIESIDKQTVEIKIKSDNAQFIPDFLKKLVPLEDSIEKVVRGMASKMMDITIEKLENRDILQKSVSDIENAIAEIERLSVQDSDCNELKRISIKIGNGAVRQLRSGTRNFSTTDERKNYWQEYIQELDRQNKEYNNKRLAILDKLSVKNQ